MDLREEVDTYTRTAVGPENLYSLIARCVDVGGAEGLSSLRSMAEHHYDGITFKFELQAPPASSLILFGEAGLKELAGIALADLNSRKAVLAMELLACITAGSALSPLSMLQSNSLTEQLEKYLASHPELREACYPLLVDIVLAYETEFDATHRISSALSSLAMSDVPAAKVLSAAMSARWSATSMQVLREFDELVANQPSHEPAFQLFLTQHPQLLDPFAIQVWPQPNLYGAKAPDFIVRRADDTYLVIEIECPGKKMMTGGLQPSADVTHAISQVTDYDHYLMKKFTELERHFPNWNMPDLLVVCGVEKDLSGPQRQALQNLNRVHHVRVVGFDWLAHRARAVSSNVILGKVEVLEKLRLI
ncbi:Shedu anti-phage system protein SduA domain-containing protein [Rhizobium leguminosarum]|uniref:Shedu anti-phage system protein SduA domain-containing protein n=1 Tax=Rhizobium leguminosarum TaxID=384 RepID=UPI00037A574A|nr:Shedu anti-phage system protein SduA domain-containing protein [Rhizobium leguminosarum]